MLDGIPASIAAIEAVYEARPDLQITEDEDEDEAPGEMEEDGEAGEA